MDPRHPSPLTALTLAGTLATGLFALPAPASAATVTIAAVQGTKRLSPYNGREVTVCGIVTAAPLAPRAATGYRTRSARTTHHK
ncbi:hypothetical protein ACWGJT_11260 [Streptomyces xantholiticus]